MKDFLGQPVIVINRPGASGRIGLDEGLSAKPDGYTLIMTPGAVLSLFPINIERYADLNKQYVAVTMGAELPYILVVHPKLANTKSLKEFATYLNDKKDGGNYGTGGAGSTYHFYTEYLLQLIGARAQNVPYRGEPAILQGIATEELDFAFVTGASKPFLDSGKLHALAVGSRNRWALYPDVPTLRELGHDIVAAGWLGYVAPRDTPADVIAKLQAAFAMAKQDPRSIRAVEQMGGTILKGDGDELSARALREQIQFKKLLDSGRVKLELQ